ADRNAHGEGEAVGADDRQDRGGIGATELAQAWMPGDPAALGIGMEASGLLRMAGANLLHVGVEQLRLGLGATPHVHALRADVDVDPGVVPAQEALDRVGWVELAQTRQLLDRLPGVAPAVGLE